MGYGAKIGPVGEEAVAEPRCVNEVNLFRIKLDASSGV